MGRRRSPAPRAHFSAEPAVTITSSPNSLPSRIAVVPMPLVPPWTSTVSPSPRAAAPEQVGPDREEGLGQAPRPRPSTAAPGTGRHWPSGRGAIFGIAAAGDQRADRLADPARIDALADRDDRARHLEARDRRRPGRRRIEAEPLHDVGPVDAGRLDPDQHFARAGPRHRPLDRLQDVGAAGRVGIDRDHGAWGWWSFGNARREMRAAQPAFC